MKFIAYATSEKAGPKLAKDIKAAGGKIDQTFAAIPELIIFTSDKSDLFWLGQFASDHLESISRDEPAGLNELQIEPIERPLLTASNKADDWHLTTINRGRIFPDIPQKRVNVFVMDTGIAAHPDFENVTHLIEPSNDGNGHGTHVAGLIASKVFGVNGPYEPSMVDLIGVKVLDDQGSGSLSTIVTGFDKILAHHRAHDRVSIVNMSLSARGQIGTMPAYHAMKKLQSEGIMFVVAAGNRAESLDHYGEYPNHLEGIDTFPAEVREALCVASVTTDLAGTLMLSPFSNFGGNCRINAPGSDIVSTYLGNDYARMSGTSMASPIAAGALALMMTSVNEKPTTGETAAKHIEQFLSALAPGKLKYVERKMHTPRLLDMAFLSMPEFLFGEPDQEQPEKPKDEKPTRTIAVIGIAIVLALALIALAGCGNIDNVQDMDARQWSF